MPTTLKILFVCVENSARSQMAEGFARAQGGGAIEAYSAGSRPSGIVNATGIRLMREKGIEMRAQRSKGFFELPTAFWSAVVTMGCGDAIPDIPVKRRLDWPLPDPKGLSLGEFRKVRDEIEERVRALLGELSASG